MTRYSYDYEDRLIEVSKIENHENEEEKVQFSYDPFGRRTEKRVVEDDDDDDLKIIRYLYNGMDVLAEYDGRGKQHARYTHGPGIDDPISMTRGKEKKSETYFYHADHLGSITHLTDMQGKVAESYEYDSFGNAKHKGKETHNPYMFAGREWDKETKLYNNRNRYYNPQTGRFINRDPIGMAGGINLYGYTGNNPVNYTDPMGYSLFSRFLNKVAGVPEVNLVQASENAIEIFKNHFGPDENSNSTNSPNSAGSTDCKSGSSSSGFNQNTQSHNITVDAMIVGDVVIQEISEGVLNAAKGWIVGTTTVLGTSGVPFVKIDKEHMVPLVNHPENLNYSSWYPDGAGNAATQHMGLRALSSNKAQEVAKLAQLIFAESGVDYKIPSAMEATAWALRNRLEGQGFGFSNAKSYQDLITKNQFESVEGTEWKKIDNGITAIKDINAYIKALIVAQEVYEGLVPDPTNAAVFFHSGSIDDPGNWWFKKALEEGRIEEDSKFGGHTFYIDANYQYDLGL